MYSVQACVGKSLQEMQQAARKRELVMAEMSVSQRAGLSRADTRTVYSAADLAPSGASRRHSAPVRSSKAEPASPTVPEWSVSGDSKEDQNAVDERAMQSQIGGFDGEQQQEDQQSLFAVSAVSTTAMQSALPGQWPETKE